MDPEGAGSFDQRARARPAGGPAAWPRLLVGLLARSVAEAGGIFLGACGLLLLWAAVFHSLSAEREQALGSAMQNTSNLARAFEETIIRSVKAVDQTLLYVRDSRRRDPSHFDIATWTHNVQALTDMAFQISIIDRDGILLGSNLAPSGNRIDLSDREHFRVHRDRGEDALFISKPVLGRASHRWSIQLTRKMLAADGSFDGVIVISLDPRYLSRFYDSVDLGSAGLVLLVGSDGLVRAGARERTIETTAAAESGKQPDVGDTLTIGRSLRGTPLLDAAAREPAGHYTDHGVVDGIERVTAYRMVRGLPLLVTVGIATDDVTRTYRGNRIIYTSVATAVSILMLAVIALIIVRQRRLTRARRMLRASEAGHAEKSALLETTLEHMSQGIMMVDGDGRVMVCNGHAMDIVGLPPSLMASRPHFAEVLRWQWRDGEFGQDGTDLETGVRDFVSAGGLCSQPHAYERTRPNGTVLEIRSTPLPSGGLVRTFTDITQSKRNEAVLRAARDQADAAAHAKSEFLATMSHEIRSPMSGLVGVLDLLRETDLDPDQAAMARMVHGSAMGLLGVLNDILDLSKIEAGGMAVLLETTAVRDFIGDIAQPYALQAARKQVALEVAIDPAIDGFAELDTLRVRQILCNILSNAVKFTPNGTIRLTADLAPDLAPDLAAGLVADAAGPMLRIEVQDSGIGMNAEVLSRLFNPFVQADSSTSRDYGGTGLGLCISKRLTSLLDGTLAVTSARGVGSTFTLSLPWRPTAPPIIQTPAGTAEETPAGTAEEAASGSAEAAASGSGRAVARPERILVADDDPTNRWLSQRQLQLLGFDVDVAEHGERAIAMLRAGRYDLLLTDCHMPRMDGVALTRAVRSSSEAGLRGLPVIGLSADATQAQQRRCAEAGMTELAYKPLGRDQLAALLSRVLGHAPEPVIEPGTASGTDAAPSEPAAPLAPPGAAVFDPGQYRDLFDDGDGDGASWLGHYLDTADALCAELTTHLSGPLDDAAGRRAVADIAHRLVGASVSVGAHALGTLARTLEHASETQPRDIVHDHHRAVLAGLSNARLAIQSFLSHHGADPNEARSDDVRTG